MKKIAHIVWSLSIGGLESMLVDIVNRQINKFSVYIIVINNNSDAALLAKVNRKCTIIFLNRKIHSKNPNFLFRLNYFLYKAKPDIVHSHGPELIKYCIKSLVKDTKFVLTIHNTNLPTTYYNRYDKLVAISKSVHEYVKNKGDYNICIIENGIDLSLISCNNKKKDSVFRMIQVGRLEHSQKGQDILIEAIQILVERYNQNNIQLDFVGDGPSNDYLMGLINRYSLNKYISFKGKKDRDAIYSNLKNYDLFLQPSRYEGFGLTVVEAMAAKVLVLVSSNEGPLEIINNGEYGYSFENENSSECAKMINQIINSNAKDNNFMIQKAFNHVYNTYSIERTTNEYNHLYLEIL